MDKIHKSQNLCVIENPKRAAAVIATLMAVTFPVPSLRVSLSLCKLETIVPAAINAERIPAQERGTPNSTYISGHAAPSMESGKPRLINAR